MKPNIFNYATRELSQEAFIAWLLNYADPRKRDRSYTFDDEGLYVCATKLIREMLFTHDVLLDSKIVSVTADCQWEGIDIWAKIELADGKKYLVIIEDKTTTVQRPNQLARYRQVAADHCIQNGFAAPVCIYLKTGNESRQGLAEVHRLGFSVIDWKTIILLMAEFSQIQNRVFSDFFERMTMLENSIHEYGAKPLNEWQNADWQGFFGFLDNELGLTDWRYVNSPEGGSWSAVLNWDYWNGFPVFIQIHKGDLAFKISTEEEESTLSNERRAEIRDEFHELIMRNAAFQGWNTVRKPASFGNGVVMTAALVEQNDWLGSGTSLLNKEQVKDTLSNYLEFLRTAIEEKVGTAALGVGE